jgi:hypothetical protein
VDQPGLLRGRFFAEEPPQINGNPRRSDHSTLTAPRNATAKKGRVTLRGTSSNAAKVEYQPGKGTYRPATGLARWTARISRLTKPVTRVIVRAISIDGSAAQRTVVVRAARNR